MNDYSDSFNDDTNQKKEESQTDFGEYFVVNDMKNDEEDDDKVSGFDKDSYTAKDDFQDSQDLMELSQSAPKKQGTQVQKQKASSQYNPMESIKSKQATSQSNRFQQEREEIEKQRLEGQRKKEQIQRELEEMNKPKKSSTLKPKEDVKKEKSSGEAYNYYKQKFGMEIDEKEESEISLDIENAPVGDEKFENEDDDYKDKDGNDFDDFGNSQVSDKDKYQVIMEKSNVPKQQNPFKDQALVQTINKNQNQQQKTPSPVPQVLNNQQIPQKQVTQPKDKFNNNGKEFEIKMKENFKEQSDIGFDDEIDESMPGEISNHSFKEQSFEQSSIRGSQSIAGNIRNPLSTQKTVGQGTMVNMASVIPNPKMVTSYTIQQQQKTSQKQGTNFYDQEQQQDDFDDIEEEEEIQMSSEKKKKSSQPQVDFQDNDSFEEVEKKIESIQPKWSPKAEKVEEKKKKNTNKIPPLQQPSKVTKAKQIGEEMLSKETKKQRPVSAMPAAPIKQSSQSKKLNNQQKNTRNANNNQDLGGILDATPSQSSREEIKEEKKTFSAKSGRIILGALRPDSAKPKVGYKGQPNLLGLKEPEKSINPNLNTNDLTEQLAKSKKFQMIKKLKEEKEKKKDMVVRNLQKANVIQAKQKEIKRKQTQPKEESKTHSMSGMNDQYDDLFQEADQIKGDQAAFPGGDEIENAQDKDENEFNSLGNTNNLDKRESVKDLKQKKQDQKPTETKTEQPWIGNALGSGMFQKLHQPIKTDNINMQLQPTKQAKPPGKEATEKETGWVKNQNSQMTSGSAQLKFQELMKEKQLKKEQESKNVLGFMMQRQQKTKQDKAKQMEDNVNKLVANFDLKEGQGKTGEINKGSDKVPDHAKLVIDNESQSKELTDLKNRLKELHFERSKIKVNIKTVEKKKMISESNLDDVMRKKSLVQVNGKLEMQSTNYSSSSTGFNFKMEDIPNYDSLIKEKANPLESIVKKIEQNQYTLEQLFILFDDNNDQILTIQEIKDGLKNQEIILDDNEMHELIKVIDQNTDGVLTLEEWVSTLNPKLDVQKEYNLIMSGLDIDDPLILEERILDLRFRLRRLEADLELMRQSKQSDIGFDLKEKAQKKLLEQQKLQTVDKLLHLEQQVLNMQEENKMELLQIEQKIKDGIVAKDQVYQDYYNIQRQKERQESEYSMRLEQIQAYLNILDNQQNEGMQHCLLLKNDRDKKKLEIKRFQIEMASLAGQEAKLDKQLEEIFGKAVDGKDLEMLYDLDLKTLRQLNSGSNAKFDSYVKHFGAVTIQRNFRGFLQRNYYKLLKFSMKRLANRLGPLYKKKRETQKYKAAILIQRMYRRKMQRKQQLERLKQKNEMRKLLEEEDEKYKQSQFQLNEAAKIIVKHWRAHKANKNKTQMKSMSIHKGGFGQTTEIICLPQIRQCIICKDQNGQRLCSQCSDAIYCEKCYLEFHMRGNRKTHSYKRVRFGPKPEDRNEIFDSIVSKVRTKGQPQQNTTKENKQPNLQQTQQSNTNPKETDNQSQNQPESQQVTKKNVTFRQNLEDVKKIERIEDIQQQSEQDQDSTVIKSSIMTVDKVVAPTKKVKLNNVEFLKSLKAKLDWAEIQGFELADDNKSIRLSDFRKGLMNYQKEFSLTENEIERICEIANDKCQTFNPNDDDQEDTLAQWIDTETLKELVNA